jgi:hypothetical protein
MNEQRFRALVAELELEASNRPRWYRFKTIALAAAGYLYIYGVFVAAIGFTVYAVRSFVTHGFSFRLAFPAAVASMLVASVARASWVRFDRIEGRELRRADAPELFKLIDEVRDKARGPRLHRVVVTAEFNAGISQHPRLGPFGWYENTLALGLPYMMAASVPGFAATLAHEYGHLAGSHGKVGAWLYRLRLNWQRLLNHVAESGNGYGYVFYAGLFAYAPFFLAYSFVLARQQEYEADRVSGELVGAQPSADDLVMMAVAGTWLREEFWPHVYRDADEFPAPRRPPHRQLQVLLKRATAHPRARAWMSAALASPSDVDDTHPSLRDRIDALGVPAQLPGPIKQSAAEILLRTSLPALIEHIDRRWRNDARRRWKARYERATKERERLAALRYRGAAADSTELRELAQLEQRFEHRPEAIAAWRRVIERVPDDAEAHFCAGKLMLAGNDAHGIALLERAAELEVDAKEAAFAPIADWFEAQGREREASRYRRVARRQAELARKADAEAERFGFDDRFEPAPVAAHELAALRKQLARESAVRAAWLVRKVLPSAPQRVLLVLALDIDPIYGAGDAVQSVLGLRVGATAALLDRIADKVKLSDEFLIVDIERMGADTPLCEHLARAIKVVSGAVLK